MKTLSRVLCAVDIDDRHRHVFEQALALARSRGAQLLVVHAASPNISFNRGATERVDFLRRLRARAEAAAVDVRVTVQRGDVAEIILLHAGARNPDLIVLGGGRSTGRGSLSGSIGERVLRKAPCPTLVVPLHASTPVTSENNVLCAVDFSPASLAAAQEAIGYAHHTDKRATVLHVVNAPGRDERTRYPWLGTHDYDRGLRAAALDKLRAFIPASERAAVATRVSAGNAADEILRAARALEAELVVIGAQRRNVVSRQLFGTTGSLLREARCPILAVPLAATAQLDRGQGSEHAA